MTKLEKASYFNKLLRRWHSSEGCEQRKKLSRLAAKAVIEVGGEGWDTLEVNDKTGEQEMNVKEPGTGVSWATDSEACEP